MMTVFGVLRAMLLSVVMGTGVSPKDSKKGKGSAAKNVGNVSTGTTSTGQTSTGNTSTDDDKTKRVLSDSTNVASPEKKRKPLLATFRMQMLNITVKDSLRSQLSNSVAHWTDSARSRSYNAITGVISLEQPAECKVVLVTFSDDQLTDIINLANAVLPLSLVEVEAEAATGPPLAGLGMYDKYQLFRAPVPVHGGVDLVPGKFNPPATTYHQLPLLAGRNNVVVAVNGFMSTNPTATATSNSPAILRVCIGGAPGDEVVVKVWGAGSKAWVLNMEPGPVLVMGLVRLDSRGNNAVEIHVNSPHFVGRLGGAMADRVTDVYGVGLVAPVAWRTITVVDRIMDDGQVTGLVLQVVRPDTGAVDYEAVITDNEIAQTMFAEALHVQNVFEWAAGLNAMEMFAGSPITGRLTTNGVDDHGYSSVGYLPHMTLW